MSKPDPHLLYVAYKEMVLKNMDTGFFNQHAGEANYMYLRHDKKFFIECLELSVKKHNASRFLDQFFEVHGDLKENPDFLREILPVLDSSSAYWVSEKKLPIGIFDGDTQFMFKVIKAMGSYIMSDYRDKLPKTRKDEKLREMLYEEGIFRFSYFDLPYIKEPDVLKSCLLQDPQGYLILDSQDINNKDYLMAALGSNQRVFGDVIYTKIPKALKFDKDVINRLVDLNFYKQEKEVFSANPELVSIILKKEKSFNDFKEIEGKINMDIFQDNRCLLELFNVVESSESLRNLSKLTDYKKLLNTLRKENSYLNKSLKSIRVKDLSVTEAFVELPSTSKKALSMLVLQEDLDERNKMLGTDTQEKAKKMKI